MEVVSPLTFARANQGGKRRFGSPIHGASVAAAANNTTAEDFDMDCSGYGIQATKRRKRFPNEGDLQSKENWTHSPFPAPSRSPHAAFGSSTKRIRTSQQDDGSAQKLQELQQMLAQQATEIQRLKSEKDSVQASVSQLVSKHAKLEHENKILKRAVAIQNGREQQMTAEVDGARQFKVQAEDRVRRLEQMNLTLQYQLQAQNSAPSNDFMGMRPPDVY